MKKKKPTFEQMPDYVEKIWAILSEPAVAANVPPDLTQRLIRLEKKVDSIQLMLSPDRPTMEVQEVSRVLKIRPKAAYALAVDGTLPSRTEGRKTLFYEDGVVKYYMTQPQWKSAQAAPDKREPSPQPPAADGRQPINIDEASAILGKSKATIYQMTSKNRIPFHKEGKKIYFFEKELREWVDTPRKRGPKKRAAR